MATRRKEAMVKATSTSRSVKPASSACRLASVVKERYAAGEPIHHDVGAAGPLPKMDAAAGRAAIGEEAQGWRRVAGFPLGGGIAAVTARGRAVGGGEERQRMPLGTWRVRSL